MDERVGYSMTRAIVSTALHHVVELLDGWRVCAEILTHGLDDLLRVETDVKHPLAHGVDHCLGVIGVIAESTEIHSFTV